MLKRQEDAKEKTLIKMSKAKKAADDKKKEHDILEQRKHQSHMHLYRQLNNQVSWEEIKVQEEQKRKDRIESRRVELLSMTKAPSCSQPLAHKFKSTQDSNKISFKAEDPEKVLII